MAIWNGHWHLAKLCSLGMGQSSCLAMPCHLAGSTWGPPTSLFTGYHIQYHLGPWHDGSLPFNHFVRLPNVTISTDHTITQDNVELTEISRWCTGHEAGEREEGKEGEKVDTVAPCHGATWYTVLYGTLGIHKTDMACDVWWAQWVVWLEWEDVSVLTHFSPSIHQKNWPMYNMWWVPIPEICFLLSSLLACD